MKRKSVRGGFPWLAVILVAGFALFAGYLIGTQRGQEHRKTRQAETVPTTPKATGEMPVRGASLPAEGPRESEKPGDGKDDCIRIEEGVRDFFRYLDGRPYIQQIEEGMDTYACFKRMILKLSSRPPIPAGEGMDSAVMTSNVFHFFRALEKKEMRLIKDVLEHEAPALEVNLDLFFKWLTLRNQCPDSERIRPSLDTLYPYAGFLLNTIGGRAYLFRRPTGLRLLVSYYCVLIIHEANKKGKNSYGIDIMPYISPLAREMGLYREFRFQKECTQRLEELERLYMAKR